jgi:hypothetical protein
MIATFSIGYLVCVEESDTRFLQKAEKMIKSLEFFSKVLDKTRK